MQRNKWLSITRLKACDAMKTASTEPVGPLNDVIGEINKAGQYTDVSGALGTAVNGQLGKLDPGSSYA